LELTQRLIAANAAVTVWSRTVPPGLEPSAYTHSVVDVGQPIAEQDHRSPDSLQGLVYCPGSITLGSFSRLTEEQFLSDYQVNLLGAVRVLKHCLRSFDSAGASVVMFSTVAVRTGLVFHASIAAAKGAVEALVRSLAAEFAQKRVRFNAIAPSLTDTPMASTLLSTPDKRAKADGRNPLGRIGTPSDLASAAEFLLSSDSSWITGQVLAVDGGYSSLRFL
jgi:NAD(P)-dependent dehydrogenase (short-subunit alcohol dehydrogenase family)